MKEKFLRGLSKALVLIMIFTSVNFSPFMISAEEYDVESISEEPISEESVSENTTEIETEESTEIEEDTTEEESNEISTETPEVPESDDTSESDETLETDETSETDDSISENDISTYSLKSSLMSTRANPVLTATANSNSIGSVSLDWSQGSSSDMMYKGYSSSDGGNTWNSISLMDYNSISQVKVLQIYPHDSAANQLKTWMETNGYGKGIIKVDSVFWDNYNANPYGYLKDSSGNWKYDVIFFGTWDANNGKNLSNAGVSATREFIETGRGCIMGHDTIGYVWGYDGLGALRDYFGIKIGHNGSYPSAGTDYNAQWGYLSSQVVITKKGLFTTYPWNIGDVGTVLNIPAAHTTSNSTSGNVWLDFTNGSYAWGQQPAALANAGYDDKFYLSTKNNCAMIQTGHSSGAATEDEQKIIANLIFYSYQVSYGTTATDNGANDTTAPNKPSVSVGSNGVSFSATDRGTTYKHKIEGYNKSNLDSPACTTNTTTTTVTTGVKGYRYIIDNNSSTTVAYNTGTYTTSQSVGVYGSNTNKYFHVAAVDGAGNISATATIELNNWVLKATGDNSGIGSVSLDWSKNSTPGMVYKGYSSTDDGKTWQSISLMDYTAVKEIKVLQIYPVDAASNQLKTWMENNSYGKGIIKVDSVSLTNYNNNPNSYLKDSSGNWKYDVIFFGTWDSNGSNGDLNSSSMEVTKQFIQAGKGCIFGHDTIRVGITYFMQLGTEFLGMSGSTKGYSGNSTSTCPAPDLYSTIKITKKGLFTTYPWNIGEIGTILTVPACHNSQQTTCDGIWLRFALPTYTDTDYANNNNFYLVTNNNCAMIQTGHASGRATDDEQKIIANLIFYSYQVSYGTTATDNGANDTTAPNAPTATIGALKVDFSATDRGTTYKHKIESYNKSNLTTPVDTTNITSTTITTGVKGYRYLIDSSSTTKITYENGTYTTSTSASYVPSDINKYFHVAAVDGTGNISETTTIKITGNTIVYNANGGTGAPAAQIKALGETITLSNTKPSRTGYTFKGWATSSTSSTVSYNPGDTYSTNANLNLYAVWSRNSYYLDVNVIVKNTTYNTGLAGFTFSVDITDSLDSSNNTKFDATNVADYCQQIPYGASYKITVNDTVGYDVVQKTITGTIGASSNYANPKWNARNDISYVVNHYHMNVDGETYSLKESVTYNNGTSDDYITVADYKQSYIGFTYDGGVGSTIANANKPASYQAKALVARDGTLVVNLYYTRNKYTVTLDLNGGNYNGSTTNKTYTLFYEQLQEITAPTREKYKFTGWTLSNLTTESTIRGNGVIASRDSIFQMGHADVTITANWSELPVFSETEYSDSFFEGQEVTVDMLKQLIMASDADKLPPDIEYDDITIDSVTYNDGTGDVTDMPNPDTWSLDTATSRIGDIDVVYSAKDVLPDISDITDPKDDIEIVTYTKTIHLLYNDLPQMSLNPAVYVYSSDSSLTEDTISDFLKSYVSMYDSQDSIDNVPWWEKDVTQEALKDSIEITKLSEISINPSYEIENRDIANQIRSYTSVEQIYALKNSNPEAFNAILNYKVTFDAHDQWGKFSSGALSEEAAAKGVTSSEQDAVQSEEDRTITVICINDSSYNNTYESVRDVSTKYISSVVSNSFWGDIRYGGKILKDIFTKKDNKESENSSTHNAYYTQTNNNNKIDIIINDYTDD